MNLIASLQARIKNKSRELGIPYASLLEQLALGRFFARLSMSEYTDQFILKGAQLFRFWTDKGHRPTRDADFLGHTLIEPLFVKNAKYSCWTPYDHWG